MFTTRFLVTKNNMLCFKVYLLITCLRFQLSIIYSGYLLHAKQSVIGQIFCSMLVRSACCFTNSNLCKAFASKIYCWPQINVNISKCVRSVVVWQFSWSPRGCRFVFVVVWLRPDTDATLSTGALWVVATSYPSTVTNILLLVKKFNNKDEFRFIW